MTPQHKKALKQEVKEMISSKRLKEIVDERILFEALDEIGIWTGELMGKLTVLDANESHEVIDECFNKIYYALIGETINQLEKINSPREKKLAK
jgi:hypothetical protein